LILGLGAFVVCVLTALIGGPFLAIPVAIICAVVIVVVGPKAREPATDLEEHRQLLPQAIAPTVQPAPHPKTPALAQASPRPYVRLEGGQLPLQCGQCGNAFGAEATNLPPWCPRCGADLKNRQPQRQRLPEPGSALAVDQIDQHTQPAEAAAVEAE